MLRKCILFTYTPTEQKGWHHPAWPQSPSSTPVWGSGYTCTKRSSWFLLKSSPGLVLIIFFRFLYDSKRKTSACTVLSSLNLLSFKGKALCCIKELQRHSDMQLNHPFCFNDARKVAGSHVGDWDSCCSPRNTRAGAVQKAVLTVEGTKDSQLSAPPTP